MSNQDNFLELMAVEVTEYIPSKPIYALYCPRTWSETLKKQSQTTDYQLELKLKELGEELHYLYPDLLSYSFKHSVIQGYSPMFVSLQPKSIGEIAEHFGRHGRNIGKQLFFSKEDATWEKCDTTHIQDHIFDWIPSYFARQFVESQVRFEVFDKNKEVVDRLKFFILNRKTIGCMTEPYSVRDKYYSYGVTFTVQTFPNYPNRFFLFIKPVHHRFVTEPLIDKKQVRNKMDGSILVRRNASVLHPFISLSVSKDMNAKDEDPVLKWRDKKITGYLNKLGKDLLLSDLLKDPVSFLNTNREITACTLYNPNTFVKGDSVIELGLGLPERNRLYQLVHKTLSLPSSLTTQKTLFNKGKGYKMFPLFINEPVQLDIQCHVSELHYDTLNQVLLSKKDKNTHLSYGCEKLGDGRFAFQTNKEPLIVKLHHIQDSYVVREIDPAKPLDSIELIREYIQHCKKQMKNSTAAIIDIKEKKKWNYDEIDPKQSVRYAFWNENMLSQFLIDDDDEIEHRAHNALADLLKDLGIYAENLSINNQDTWLFIKGNSITSLPKVLISRYKNQKVDYLLQDSNFGWKSIQDVILHPDGLRRSLSSNRGVRPNQASQVATAFIESILDKELTLSSGNVYVVFDRSSLAKLYKSVNNNRLLNNNSWEFMNSELSQYQRLKIIRLTDSTHQGVPDYISHSLGKKEHFISGLYFCDGHFYSLPPKGDLTRQSPLRERSYWNKPLRQPNLLEFYPVGDYWDLQEKEMIISQLHYWRKASISFKDSTILPAPMHSLGTLRKYMDMHCKVNEILFASKSKSKLTTI